MSSGHSTKYVWSDPHFNHERIMNVCRRPFNSVSEMNDVLIKNYNDVIRDDNAVCYWLGDVMYNAKTDSVRQLLQKMTGRKYLLLGNHDRNHSETWWRNCGFEKVFTYPQFIPEMHIMLSHEPLLEFQTCVPPFINIHGHIHNNGYDDEFTNTKNFMNVSVEEIGYKPILLQNPNLIMNTR